MRRMSLPVLPYFRYGQLKVDLLARFQYSTLNVGLSSGSTSSLIVNPRRRDVRVPQPLLDLRDIGVVRKRIRRRGRSKRVHAEAVTSTVMPTSLP